MNYQDLTFPYCLYDVEDYNLKDLVTVHSQAEYDILDKDRWLKYSDAKEIQDAVKQRLKEIEKDIDSTAADGFDHNTDAGEIQELEIMPETQEEEVSTEFEPETMKAIKADMKVMIFPITMVDKEGNSKICGTRRTAEKWLAEGWLPK